MYRFPKYPQWIIIIFSLLCLFQVRAWFEEVIASFNTGQNSFFLEGHRFILLPNRSFIVDESLKTYGLNLNYKHKLN
jgi:hypothetical protein